MKAKKLHVLQRLNWSRCDKLVLRLPGSTRLRSFARAADAERHRKQSEEKARAAVNPFQCGGTALHDQTSLDEGRLCDWLLDAGIEPPAPAAQGARAWADWWEKARASLTDYQRGKVWEALDKVRFYEVVEREARPVVYLVVKVGWRYNDDWFEAEDEGGEVPDTYYTYRDRKEAEANCEDNNDMARDSWGEDVREDEPMFEIVDRLRRQEGDLSPRPPYSREAVEKQLLPLTKVAFWEVIEVEVDDL